VKGFRGYFSRYRRLCGPASSRALMEGPGRDRAFWSAVLTLCLTITGSSILPVSVDSLIGPVTPKFGFTALAAAFLPHPGSIWVPFFFSARTHACDLHVYACCSDYHEVILRQWGHSPCETVSPSEGASLAAR